MWNNLLTKCVLQQLKKVNIVAVNVVRMDEAKKYAHAKRNPTLLLLYYDSSGAVSPGTNVLQKPTVLLRTTEIWIRPARQSAPLQALTRLSMLQSYFMCTSYGTVVGGSWNKVFVL